MDATRKRRTKDQARRVYYAGHRQRRFAQHMGFAAPSAEERLILRPSDHGPFVLAEAVASPALMLRAG
jgi:hypothetical protein